MRCSVCRRRRRGRESAEPRRAGGQIGAAIQQRGASGDERERRISDILEPRRRILLSMPIQSILDQVPDYARDLKVNLQNVLQQQELTPQQTWMCAVACAIASRQRERTHAIAEEAAAKVAPEAVQAGRTAGALMGMNNVFYRFRHFIQAKPEYAQVPARLRMQAIRSHGGDPVD